MTLVTEGYLYPKLKNKGGREKEGRKKGEKKGRSERGR